MQQWLLFFLGFALFVTCILSSLYLIVRLREKTNSAKLDGIFDEDTRRMLVLLILLLVMVYLGYIFYTELRGILSTFLVATIFAYLLNPVVNLLEKKMKRSLATITVFTSFLAIIFVIVRISVPAIGKEIASLTKQLPDYFNLISDYADQLISSLKGHLPFLPEDFRTAINDNIDSVQEAAFKVVGFVTSYLVDLASSLFNVVMVPILMFYFMLDGKLFKAWVYSVVPSKIKPGFVSLTSEINVIVASYIRGQLLLCLILGVLTTLGLMVLGIDFALVTGVVAGITNIIPYIGPVMGAIPAAFFGFSSGGFKTAFLAVLWILLVQQLESNVLAPKIVGKSVGLHPVIVIFALLAGGKLLGFVGLVIAVPLAASIRVLISRIIIYVRG